MGVKRRAAEAPDDFSVLRRYFSNSANSSMGIPRVQNLSVDSAYFHPHSGRHVEGVPLADPFHQRICCDSAQSQPTPLNQPIWTGTIQETVCIITHGDLTAAWTQQMSKQAHGLRRSTPGNSYANRVNSVTTLELTEPLMSKAVAITCMSLMHARGPIVP